MEQHKTLYFRDNFFSAGRTEIFTGRQELIAAVMGVNAIEKRRRSASASS